jgi:hypothetical protein
MLSVKAWITILDFFLILIVSIAIESGTVLLLEIARQEDLVIVLGSLLAATNEAK